MEDPSPDETDYLIKHYSPIRTLFWRWSVNHEKTVVRRVNTDSVSSRFNGSILDSPCTQTKKINNRKRAIYDELVHIESCVFFKWVPGWPFGPTRCGFAAANPPTRCDCGLSAASAGKATRCPAGKTPDASFEGGGRTRQWRPLPPVSG